MGPPIPDEGVARGITDTAHKRPSVQFLVHGAERSGPPIYLLRLLRQWQRVDPGFGRSVLLARPGPLRSEFERVAPTRSARLDRNSPERSAARALRRAGAPRAAEVVADRATRARAGRSNADLTVLNGATQPTADLLRSLQPRGPVALIAHELSTGWQANIDADARHLLRTRVVRVLAVSRCVADYLCREEGFERDQVTVLRPPVPPVSSATEEACSDRWPESASNSYTRPRPWAGTAVVGGAGVQDWRKAPELWLQVAARVRSRLGPDATRWVWYGGNAAGGRPAWPIRHELGHLGLDGQVEFAGEVDDLAPHLADMRVFVSTAREDAYPLVCAEACAAGVPVVSFDGGGAAELVLDSGGGHVVTYPDLDSMADRVVELLSDADQHAAISRCAHDFAAANLDPAVVAPEAAAWILEGAVA